MFAVGEPGKTAWIGWSVGEENGHVSAGLQGFLCGVDCGADGGGVELCGCGQGWVEKELGSFACRCGLWLRVGGWVGDEDALAYVAAGELTEVGYLRCC